MESAVFWFKFHWNNFSMVQLKISLGRVMAWHRRGHKHLPGPMWTKICLRRLDLLSLDNRYMCFQLMPPELVILLTGLLPKIGGCKTSKLTLYLLFFVSPNYWTPVQVLIQRVWCRCNISNIHANMILRSALQWLQYYINQSTTKDDDIKISP